MINDKDRNKYPSTKTDKTMSFVFMTSYRTVKLPLIAFLARLCFPGQPYYSIKIEIASLIYKGSGILGIIIFV